MKPTSAKNETSLGEEDIFLGKYYADVEIFKNLGLDDDQISLYFTKYLPNTYLPKDKQYKMGGYSKFMNNFITGRERRGEIDDDDDDTSPLTTGNPHFTDLSGGRFRGRWKLTKLTVPDEALLRFYMKLARMVVRQKNEKLGGARFKSNFMLQECTRKNDLVRIWIDIDSQNLEITKQMVSEICSLYIEEYKKLFIIPEYVIRDENFYHFFAFGNVSDPKHKVHVVFPNLYLRKKVLKHITQEVANRYIHGEIIDKALSGLRLPWAIKWDEVNNKPNWNSQYIPEYTNDIHRIVTWFMLTRIRALNGVEELEMRDEYKKLFLPKELVINCRIEDGAMEIIDKKVAELEGIYRADYKDEEVSLIRVSPGKCEICEREHEKENATIFCRMGKVYLWCYRGSRPLCLGEYRGATQQEVEDEMKLEEARLRVEEFMFIPPRDAEIEEYEEDVIRPLIGDYRTFFTRSRMNTEKSRMMRKTMAKDKPNSVVVLSSRRNYSQNELASLRRDTGLPFILYSEINGLLNYPYIVLQVESLHRLIGVPEYLVLDEIESLIEQFDSPYHGKWLKDNREKLELLIANVSKVFAFDADLSGISIKFIRTIRPGKCKIQWNKKKFEGRKAYWVRKYNIWMDKLLEYAKEGKKIGIPVAAKDIGRDIQVRLEELGLKTRFYHSKGNDYPEDFADVNEAWSRYDAIIFTCKVGLGVDFNIEHFDYIFQYVSYKLTWRQQKQMLGRIRKIRSNEVYYYICEDFPQGLMKGPESVNKIRKHIDDGIFSTLKIRNEIISTGLVEQFVEDDTFKYRLQDNKWADILLECLRRKNKSYHYLPKLWKICLEEDGYIVENIESTDEEDNKKSAVLKKQNKELDRKETIDLWDSVPARISLFEEREIESNVKSGNATEEEKMIIDKNKWHSWLRDDEISSGEEYYETKDWISYIRQCVRYRDTNVLEDFEDQELKLSEDPFKRTNYNKRYWLQVMNDLLGVRDVFDKEYNVSSQKFAELTDVVRGYLPDIKLIYPGIRDYEEPTGRKSNYVWAKDVINTIYRNYLGMEFKRCVDENGKPIRSQPKVNGRQIQIYYYYLDFIQPICRNLFNKMKPITLDRLIAKKKVIIIKRNRAQKQVKDMVI